MDFWYNFTKNIVRLYLAFLVKEVNVQGQENIPEGPKIIIANHALSSDAFILPFIFPEKLHFLIEAELFTVPFIGRMLALADQIPVLVGQGRESLKAARDRLIQGNSVVIFPEGRLNHGEDFHRAGAGAATLALQTGMPVLPIGFYTPSEFVRMIRSRVFDRESLGGWQMGGRCYVRIGEPLDTAFYASAEKSYKYLRTLTDQMMSRVALLVQQAMQEARALPASE